MTRRVDKPWGYEEVWAETKSYVGKVLVIREGKRLSLQYHRLKTETLYVERGRLRCHVGPDDDALVESVMGPGDVLHVLPGTRHRLEALEESRLYEVSTPELDDVVRLEDDFGRQGTSDP